MSRSKAAQAVNMPSPKSTLSRESPVTAQTRDTDDFEYDVCLSFAGEDRDYVEAVADTLRDQGVRVFYDRYEQVELWGKDLYTHLDDVYRHSARYCVMFVSRHYANKLWTNHERQSAQARALKENAEYVLPARFDDTDVPGLRETIGYVDLRRIDHDQLVAMIKQKIGDRQTTNYLPPVPDRLFKALDAENDDERNLIYVYAHRFLNVLRRMSSEERTILFQVFLNCCPAELPGNVHIDIDLLRRHTGFAPRKLKRILGNLRSLGVYTSLRDGHRTSDEQVGKLHLFVIEWHDTSVDGGGNATFVASKMIECAIENYCEEHGDEALDRLDFSQLASATTVTDEHLTASTD
jgi:hypothetical protein